MEKEESEKFIQYMAKKLKVNSQKELETALQSMGEDKLKSEYEAFKREDQPMYKGGGSLKYIKCLKYFKKGGIVDCGCGKKMNKGGNIQKAFLGALLGGLKGVMAGAKTAGTLAQGANTAMKVGKGMQQAGNVINAGKQILGNAKQFMNPRQVVPQTIAPTTVGINPQVSPGLNPVTSQNTPTLNARSIPTFTPSGTESLTKPMYQEDGGKLKKLQGLDKFSKKKK